METSDYAPRDLEAIDPVGPASKSRPGVPSKPTSSLSGEPRDAAAPSPAADMRPSFAGYEVLKRIGTGGMGEVFLARSLADPSRQVAIKRLLPVVARDQRMIERIRSEASKVAKLRHDNILPIIDSDPQGRWFVMPYVEGGSLNDRLISHTPVDGDTVLRIALQVADALKHAHEHSIVHRDIKPANILLDANGNALVCDFGLARSIFDEDDKSLGSNARISGTLPYMAPELFATRSVWDFRIDIYGLGATLYELLAGRQPYEGTAKEIAEAIRMGPPTPLVKLNPAICKAWSTIVETAMAPQLRDRYATMADLQSDLECLKAGRTPVGAANARRGPPPRQGVASPRLWLGVGGGLLGAAVLTVAAVVGVQALNRDRVADDPGPWSSPGEPDRPQPGSPEAILLDLYSAVDAGNDLKAIERLQRDLGTNDPKSSDGRERPLVVAVRKGNVDVVRALLRGGAAAAVPDGRGWTALHVAADDGQDALIEALVKDGKVGIDSPVASTQQTALHLAIKKCRGSTVAVLLRLGAKVDRRDLGNATPLHAAAACSDPEIARQLLDAGAIASIQAQDSHGRAPLHEAAWTGRVETVKLLLGRGANKAAKDGSGKTARDLAVARAERRVAGCDEIAALLANGS